MTRSVAAGLLVGLVLVVAAGLPARADDGRTGDGRTGDRQTHDGRALSVEARPIPLVPGDPDKVTVGVLRWRGGLALTGDDPGFGGWSDLEISPDGRHLTALGDRGAWAVATILRDGDGIMTGLAEARIGTLAGPDGRPLERRRHETDAEGLARLADGGLAVSFEGRHRLWRYPPRPGGITPLAGRPVPLPALPGLDRAPVNGGLEALAALADGSLVGFTEELRDDDGYAVGWRLDRRGRSTPLRLTTTGAFKPTGLARLDTGDLLLAERRYMPFLGPGLRLSVIAAEDLGGGAPIATIELAVLDASFNIDNFEGVGVWQAPGGERRLIVLSDDNFNPLQRTLLLEFALPDGAPAER